MFFSSPPSIQRLPPALAAATSSSAAVPSLEAALAAALSAAAATTATAANKITVSFFNSASSSPCPSWLSPTSYNGFEVEDTGHGYDEAFLRGIAAVAAPEPGENQTPTRKLLLLHPLSSLASSASPSLPLSVSVTSRPRGGFETRVAEYSGGKLERIRMQPPPGRARPGASVRVLLSASASAAAAASTPTASPASTSSLPSSSSVPSASSLVDIVLAFALAREDVPFTALDARTKKVLLESEGKGRGGGAGGGENSSDEENSLVLRALGSPASPPSYSAGIAPSSSISAKLWALVPPEGELSPSSEKGSSSSPCFRRRCCFVSVDGSPVEAPSLEAEVDCLFAEICTSLHGERRRGGAGGRGGGGGGQGGSRSGGGSGSGGFLQKERGTAARARRVAAFVLKLSTAATATAGGSGGSDDAAPFCGRMGLPLLLSLGGRSPSARGPAAAAAAAQAAASEARACVREAALACWRAAAPARLLADPLLLLGGPPPPPRPQQQQQQQQKRPRFDGDGSIAESFGNNDSNAAAAALRRAPRSAPAALVSSSSAASLSTLAFHPRLFASAAAPSSSQHPDSILTLEQLAAGASALVTPQRGRFDDWGALSASPSSSSSPPPPSAVRPLSQLTAIDGRGSPTFLVAVVDSSQSSREKKRSQKQKRQLLVVFDPHAAHERVRLELLTASYLSSPPAGAGGADGGGGGGAGGGRGGLSLPLPRPCELHLPRAGDDAEALRRHAAGLARWGWRWASSPGAGGETVVVSLSHAAAVAGTRLSAADLLDHARALRLLSSSPPSDPPPAAASFSPPPPPAAPRALASRACRGAYMFSAGHRLSSREASSLLDSLSRTLSPGICAHGRPTASTLVDLGRVRALVEARVEARRGEGGGGRGGGDTMVATKMRVTNRRATTTTTMTTLSLSALVESLRLRVSQAERGKEDTQSGAK